LKKLFQIYAVAAVAELLSEPLYNVFVSYFFPSPPVGSLPYRAMVDLKTNVRIRAEGFGITAKSILTFLILVYDSREGNGDFALVAFAVGQLAYSVVMFLTYVASFGWGIIRPKRPSSPRHALFTLQRSISDLLTGTLSADTSTGKPCNSRSQ